MGGKLIRIFWIVSALFYCGAAWLTLHNNNLKSRRQLQDKLFYKYLERRNYYRDHLTTPLNYILMKEYQKIIEEINEEYK